MLCLGVLPDRAAGARPGVGRRQPRGAARLVHRPRRHRRRERAGVGRLRRRRGRRRQAPERAGRRPVRGEAADRGVPRRCSTPASSSASRTSAAPASPARPARRRHAAASGMDVYVAAVPRARAGHGAVRGHDERVPGADARHRRARATSTRCSRSASAGRCGASVVGTVTDGGRAAHPRRLRRRGAGRRAGVVAPRRRAALRPAASPRRPTAPRAGRRPGAAAGPADCGADLLGDARRHVVGLVAVRPPAVPQHRRGPGRRRRRAAAQAPDHRRRHRPRRWRSPPTATTAGARSTRAPAPRWSWPSRCSTSRASAPARSRSSTA